MRINAEGASIREPKKADVAKMFASYFRSRSIGERPLGPNSFEGSLKY